MVATDFFERLRAIIQAVEPSPDDSDWKEDLYTNIQSLVNDYSCHHCPRFVIGDDSPSTDVTPTPERKLSDPSMDPSLESAEEETPEANDDKILARLKTGQLKHRELEKEVGPQSAVHYRRKYVEEKSGVPLADLPHLAYDYETVLGACCENPIGYMPIPVGIAGPLFLQTADDKQGREVFVPMATTEGALVASTNRGCAALRGIGVRTTVKDVGMTRAPVLAFPSNADARECEAWLEDAETFATIKKAFEGTSRFAKLKSVEPWLSHRYLFIRFVATTGDAMGMNMVTKAAKAAVEVVRQHFPNAQVVSLSGNMCVDKKASAMNWIRGRGKSVTAEVVIPAVIVERMLHTTVDKMVELGQVKLGIGSSIALTIGGSNAHAANVVAAIFAATGQDLAQVVSSSMCSTLLEKTASGDLSVTCTMNCLEVGTVGGGTILAPQKASLSLIDCCGGHQTKAGENSKRLAQVICATVLAGELSLLAAQCSDHLVQSHMKLNRSTTDLIGSRSVPVMPTSSSPLRRPIPPVPEHEEVDHGTHRSTQSGTSQTTSSRQRQDAGSSHFPTHLSPFCNPL